MVLLEQSRNQFRGYFCRFRIAERPLGRLFERHAQDFVAQLRRQRFTAGDETEQTPDCRKATVPRQNPRFAFVLYMLQEGEDVSSGEIIQTKNCYLFSVSRRRKAQEEAPRLTIRLYGLAGGISLFDQPLVEEGMQQAGQAPQKSFGHLHLRPITFKTADSAARKRSLACRNSSCVIVR